MASDSERQEQPKTLVEFDTEADAARRLAELRAAALDGLRRLTATAAQTGLAAAAAGPETVGPPVTASEAAAACPQAAPPEAARNHGLKHFRRREPMRAERLPIIHVGFGFSGTTSLQENLLSRRANLFYAGIPYGELGGIFSSIKYQEPEQYDRDLTARFCNELIFKKMADNQRLVLSDETFVEQPAIYFTPVLVPVGMIAGRLLDLFGESVILFTLRNQYRSVISNYLTLKKNATAEGCRIEPFDAWIIGNHTQLRNLYLRNLDASYAIKIYRRIFGVHAVHVLPLELLTEQGTAAYLAKLAEIIGLEISPRDVENYVKRNASPTNEIELNPEQRALICRRAGAGNAFIAQEFDLPLREFGYPWPVG